MDAASSDHPTREALNSYSLGKLDEYFAQSVSRHLDSCPECQRRVAEMSSDSFLGKLQDVQARPDRALGGMSQLAISTTGVGPAIGAPPLAETLPPGLADHPDYEIKRELGRGGMGVVYLAQNTLMGRPEVLKVVSAELINRPNIFERFAREIRSAAMLRHANIVTAYAALRVGESIVLSMEYVEGLDLAKLVKAKGPLPVTHACNYAYQAALGLQHAHEQGMVHRDIKPANLILSRDGNKALIKVLDFGLAKVNSEGQIDKSLTREGQALGTPDYIAPEQIRNAQSADIRADIYSLGCTLYYLLTGQPPFAGDHLWDIYQAHFSRDAELLNFVRPEVPAELAVLAAKMMAKEPERRFQTPKEVAAALKPFFASGGAATAGSIPTISQFNDQETKNSAAGLAVSPETTAAGSPQPSVPGEKPAPAAQTEPEWQSMVDTREAEPSALVERGSRRRPPWLWPAVVAAALVGLIIAWQVTIKIKTPEGLIVLKELPEQSTVIVDGKSVQVRRPDGGLTAEITVDPGKHELHVEKEGFTMEPKEVLVDRGGTTVLFVELRRRESGPPKKAPADDLATRVATNGASVARSNKASNQPKDEGSKPPTGATIAAATPVPSGSPADVVAKAPVPTKPQNAAPPPARTGLIFDGRTRVTCDWLGSDATGQDFTIFARIKTRLDGTILSNTADGKWVPGGKALFVHRGRLSLDIGWVRTVATERTIADDQWHNVVVTYVQEEELVQLFIDGVLESEARLESKVPEAPSVMRIGYGAANFPNPTYFQGLIAEVRFYKRALSEGQAEALSKGADREPPDARWSLDALASAGVVRDETGHGHDGKVEVGPVAAVAMAGGAVNGGGPAEQPVNANQPGGAAASLSPEDVLKKYGVQLVDGVCSLADEAAVIQAVNDAQRFYTDSEMASMEQQAMMNAADVIPELDAWVNQYQVAIAGVDQNIAHVRRQGRGVHPSAHQGLQLHKQQLQNEQKQVRDLLGRLRRQAFDPEAGPRLAARRQSSWQKHENALTDFRRRLEAARKKYNELRDNEELRQALRALSRRFGDKFELVPSEEFNYIVQWFEEMQRNKRKRGNQ
jgi:serine/threonine protein kinase